MNLNSQQIQQMTQEMLKKAGLFDFLSLQEKERLEQYFYSVLLEFEEKKPIKNFSNQNVWTKEVKNFIIDELEIDLPTVFSIKDFGKRLDIEAFLNLIYNNNQNGSN